MTKVKGLAEMEALFKKRVPKAVRAAATKTINDQAQKLVKDMQRVAPRGRTGRLRKSIKATMGDRGGVTVGNVRGRSYGTIRAIVSAGAGNAFYARWVEFGTIKTAARPFFFPVYRARRKKIRAAINRSINKAIKGLKK